MSQYVFVTFAPIQGFIEKSRKLRDLYGASLILSHLSSKLIYAAFCQGAELISPGLPNFTQGMPNRILVKGNFSEKAAHDALIEAWGEVLEKCRTYLEAEIKSFCNSYNPNDLNFPYNKDAQDKQDISNFCQVHNRDNQFYTWHREWEKWKNYTWELFWAEGDTVDEARQNLERRKLSRRWIAINWIGESSSISGADAIAYPRLEAENINIKHGFPASETNLIKGFYKILAIIFDGRKNQWIQDTENYEIEGKFIAGNERLSIPELVKRLVTHRDVGQSIGIEPPKKFKDIVRLARNTGQEIQGHWTGWFMGDGDNMGEHLKTLAQESDDNIRRFSKIMRTWGQDFKENFSRDVGRIIYAGGDDFFGIIYSGNPQKPIPSHVALEELISVHEKWENNIDQIHQEVQPLLDKEITVSIGFVWVGASVPQRDVLQHCREAEKQAKKQGKNRLTIRVVFNNGQYREWTCPWKHLELLKLYCDRDGNCGATANWNHIYNDWEQLKARHAIRLQEMQGLEISKQIAMAILDLYFNDAARTFEQQRQWDEIAGDNSASAIVKWIDDLIQVGWQLCPNLSLNSNL